jgi:hypothetical protein
MSILEFSTSVDIAARACQFCGDFRLNSFDDISPQAREIAFAYDKLRVAELQRIVWRFATRRAVLRPIDTTTMGLVPALWSSTAVYTLGSIVSYNGLIYVSQGFPLVGVTPDTPPLWSPYFGPMTISVWQNPAGTSTNPPNIGYYAGELVYYPAAENYVIYVSLSNANTDTPGAYPNWDPTIIYKRGDTVIYPSQGQLLSEPGDIPVFSSPGNIPVFSSATGPWQSQSDLNLNDIPGSDGNWVLVPAPNQLQFRTGQNWVQLDATLQGLNIIYPLGVGPCTDSSTRNIYKLPNGYLKHAPDQTDPNVITRVMSFMSAAPTDAQFENGYMVTSEIQSVMLRFIADMTDVTKMDDLFCEALAARIARDIHPAIVEKSEQGKVLMRTRAAYKEAIADARSNDAVERGASAQPQSPYLTVRF